MDSDNVLDLKRAMNLAINDIQGLRQTNQLLSAKVEVIDLIAALVFPNRSTGMAEDTVWLLRRALASLEPQPEATEVTGVQA